MFDKLIVSEPEGADFKNRRSYFMVSSLVVGVLFATAVVISIFAADFNLGSSNFELVEMIAPTDMAAVEPETPQPQSPARNTQSQTQIAIRQVNMANVNDPTIAPTTVSTTKNNQMARPDTGRFIIGDRDSEPVNYGSSGRDVIPGTGGGISTSPPFVEDVKLPEPPPIKAAPPVRPTIRTLGVINGIATSLPKPQYPPAARAINLQGKVDVHVLIDEEGSVVSAKAVSGSAIFHSVAVQAARNAKFTPTYLSKVPVKVTGVIVYNFTR